MTIPSGIKSRIIAGGLLGFCFFFLPVLFLFLFPGAFIVFSKNKSFFDPGDFIKTITHTIFFSFSFWVLSYWITQFVPIQLTHLFYACNSAFLMVFIRKSDRIHPAEYDLFSKKNMTLCFLLLLICSLRMVPHFNKITGSVGDMTQHNAMTKIIMHHDGYSKTYEPVIPFKNFGEYPLGFHTLSALLAMTGNIPFYRATSFVTSMIYLLITLSLYLFLSRSFSKIFSLALSGLLLSLSHYPQFLNQWGSSPTALSTAFLIFSCTFLDEKTDQTMTLAEKCAVGAAMAAGALSHLIPPIGFLIYFSAHLFPLKTNGSLFLKRYGGIFAFLLLFLTPFLLNFDFSVFERSKSALIHGHEESLERVIHFFNVGDSFINKFLIGFPVIYAFIFGPTFAFLSAASLAFFLVQRFFNPGSLNQREKTHLISFVASLCVFCLLVILFRYRTVPGYHLLQTERIHYFLLIPSSIMIALFLEKILKNRSLSLQIALSSLFFIPILWNALDARERNFKSHYTLFKETKHAALFLLRDLSLGSYFAFALDSVNASVTDSDIRAFEWIKRNVEDEAVFLTNYGDGGRLISSIAERKTWNLHGMDLWHGEDLKKWQNQNKGTHIYIGKLKHPKYEATYQRKDLEKEPDRYRLIYDSEDCRVYQINNRK